MTTTLHFPRYLLPSLPVWRSGRKRSSTNENATTTTPPTISRTIQTLESGAIASTPRSLLHTSTSETTTDDYDFTTNDAGNDVDDDNVDDAEEETTLEMKTSRSARNNKQNDGRSVAFARNEDILQSNDSYLTCQRCQAQLCFTSSIVSKGFTGRHGRAYLVTDVLTQNIIHQKPTTRTLQTGAHTVSDISCASCSTVLGWQYLHAEDRSQRYKVGKYILETGRVGKINSWEHDVGSYEGDMVNQYTWRFAGGADGGGFRGGGGGECTVGEGDGGIGGSGNTSSGASSASLAGNSDSRFDGSGLGTGTIGTIYRKGEVHVDIGDDDELEDLFMGSWDLQRALKRRARKQQEREKEMEKERERGEAVKKKKNR